MQNIFRNQTNSPIGFCTQIITNVHFFLDMSKAVDQTHSKKHTDSYLPPNKRD